MDATREREEKGNHHCYATYARQYDTRYHITEQTNPVCITKDYFTLFVPNLDANKLDGLFEKTDRTPWFYTSYTTTLDILLRQKCELPPHRSFFHIPYGVGWDK